MNTGAIRAVVTVIAIIGGTFVNVNAAEKRECAPNFVAKGSMVGGRTFTSWKVYPNAKKGAAFDSIVPAVVSSGYQISNSSKDQGLISANKMSSAAFWGAGGTNSLTVIVSQTGSGLKVETTLSPQGGAGSMSSILDLFCRVFDSVH